MNLILGQGVAGSVLALTLLEAGQEVMLIDDGHRSSSSMVAAGLWNPIVFRRINKSWMADDFVPALDAFYISIENKLHTKFYHAMPVWRKHSSALESTLWHEKRDTSDFATYLGPSQEPESSSEFGEFPFGSAMVKGSGYLDLPAFLSAVRNYLSSLGAFRQMGFQLPQDPESVNDLEWDQSEVTRIIDCRGYKSAADLWWSYLPFGLTKGEVLIVRSEELRLNEIFNAGFFVQPLGGNLFRIGATFDWQNKDEIPTRQGREFLLEKLKKHITADVEVVNQSAGVRPTVQDRRPLIGQHPNCRKLYLFNGLGTKGVMLAPYLAKHFADHLILGSPLLSEANIARFDYLMGQQEPQISHPAGPSA